MLVENVVVQVKVCWEVVELSLVDEVVEVEFSTALVEEVVVVI